MTEKIEDWMSTREAANESGMPYEKLKLRIRKGKIPHQRMGWNIIIHKDVVKQLKKEMRDAANKRMEKRTR